MLDIQNAPAVPHIIRREDYRPPDWLVPTIDLDFDLAASATRVKARLSVARHGDHDRPLVLDGDGLTPLAVRVDGAAINDWTLDDGKLIIAVSDNAAIVETEVEIAPEKNTQLMGLYASGGLLCTQCEAEGFRRITFFPDRPDVLSSYTVRMTADAATYPILLANGDNVANGRLDDGRHWAEWRDPHPKPSYLFALVASDLKANRDRFVTMSGRRVDLGIWVREGDLPKTAHAMAALKTAMKWDEDVYGREYDLDVFNIVAVDDFNFGAMENKGLNIFNSRYILADPETATDVDYDAVLGVVAHEYFHNWSGNRVTCRDWFQLSLKEGFTVFRDQQFSGDQGSAAVKRIEDVRVLRAAQFPEDAGPLAHPIRPDSYMEIGNFYTATVYNKGAEVIRMLHTLLGPETFRAGSDLYFARHDGQAVTCDDFVKAMEDASGVDLSRFRLWYAQAGTPKLRATLKHESGATVVALEQIVPETPGQPLKQPMPLPLDVALFDRSATRRVAQQLFVLDDASAELRLPEAKDPVLSINRNFSAPVIVETGRSAADLAFLSAHDDDPFGRYEAMQQLMLDTLVRAIATGVGEHEPVIDAIRNTLDDAALDPAFVAETILLPSEAFVGDHLAVVDPDRIAEARNSLRSAILNGIGATTFEALWRSNSDATFAYTPVAKGRRRLKALALGYLMAEQSDRAIAHCVEQYEAADNMTDRLAALGLLSNVPHAARDDALGDFYERYRGNALVLDKWFSTQAFSTREDTVEAVAALLQHPDYTLSNPNRVRAVIGAFSYNQRWFHRSDGAGYALLADQIVALDPINPQTAAKLVPPLGRWRRFDSERQTKMRAALERIAAAPKVSKDVYEQATKSLG